MAGSQKLGARIKAARAERGWKQKHLAAKVAVEPITVSRWERGATAPDLDVLGVVAEATGKPLSFFVDDAPGAGVRPAGAGAPAPDAVARLEAAADRITAETARLAALLEEVRVELARANGRAE